MLGRSNQICIRISIHAPIRERPLQVFLFFRLFHFNPCPHTGATPDHVLPLPGGSHFNPRPHTGATSLRPSVQRPGSISIHAPIRGRPEAGVRRVPIARHFNPRPLAGATHPDPGCGRARCNFNPRPLAGATNATEHLFPVLQFQSTPPCGGDTTGRPAVVCTGDFNPRPLAGATDSFRDYAWGTRISIHAPLRGRQSVQTRQKHHQTISIHAPLRGRHIWPARCWGRTIFQSTPPCGGDAISANTRSLTTISIHAPLRGRLQLFKFLQVAPCISIHAPLRGRLQRYVDHRGTKDFNPRPLAGATYFSLYSVLCRLISIHAPLRGRPVILATSNLPSSFQSTPPCGGDQARPRQPKAGPDFNPRPLAGATSLLSSE